MSASEAAAVTEEILELAAQGGHLTASVRRALRHLRQQRADGSSFAAEAAGGGASDAARRILEGPGGAAGANASPAPPVAVEEGVACRVTPPMPSDARKVCFVVYGALSPSQCQALVAQCDAGGWAPASLEYGLGSGDFAGESVVNFHLRDSDRCILHDDELALTLWHKLRPLIPDDAFQPLRPARVNPCFRCLRYNVGHAGFAKHVDGTTVASGDVSRLTVQLYLNEGFEGGVTRLCHVDDSSDAESGVNVVPRIGMALVFDGSILHKGCPVTCGTKYTARTEVMYRGGSGSS